MYPIARSAGSVRSAEGSTAGATSEAGHWIVNWGTGLGPALILRQTQDEGGSSGRESRYFSSTTRERRVPILLISTSSTSPAFIQTGGLRLAPMPSGVPVAITSPGDNSVNVEQ